MLDTVIAEQPMFDLRIFPALGRLFKGLTKVFAQPVRVEFVKQETDMPDGPVAVVYAVQPVDGAKREVYIYWDGGPLDMKFAHFVERNAAGEFSRVVPEKEERVPDEWRKAISVFAAKEQGFVAPKKTLG